MSSGRRILGPGVILPVLSSAPASPEDGLTYIDAASDQIRSWDADDGVWRVYATSSSAAIPAGTSLPASPSDGDAYVYNADTTNGVKWPLQYRSGASGSYKWESLGGPWLEKNVATAYNQTTANTWQQLNSSLQITLPLSGYYDFELVTYAYDNAGTNNGKIIVAPYANSPAAVAGPSSYNFHGFNGGYGISARGTGRTGLCDKNYPLRFYVFSNPGAFTMQDWWIRVRPVRVG